MRNIPDKITIKDCSIKNQKHMISNQEKIRQNERLMKECLPTNTYEKKRIFYELQAENKLLEEKKAICPECKKEFQLSNEQKMKLRLKSDYVPCCSVKCARARTSFFK
jgi:predicted  nucleic acid-binding Zn ribbon protein